MSSGDSNWDRVDDFRVVKHKRKSCKINTTIIKPSVINNYQQLEKDKVLRNVDAAELDIKSSDLYASVTASLREAFGVLNNFKINEIICFGLGNFGECLISRYQLALLRDWMQKYSDNVKVYDPVFNNDEVHILQEIGFEILTENCEGKYKVRQLDGLTLFYLPHCPKQLMNNMLWTNWSPQELTNCVIIGNSFQKIMETNTKTHLSRNASFITQISPYALELAIINTFKYYEIFNDMAIHVFPLEKIALLPKDFWHANNAPIYDNDEVEFITKNIATTSISNSQ